MIRLPAKPLSVFDQPRISEVDADGIRSVVRCIKGVTALKLQYLHVGHVDIDRLGLQDANAERGQRVPISDYRSADNVVCWQLSGTPTVVRNSVAWPFNL